jgi:hypothetical protein
MEQIDIEQLSKVPALASAVPANLSELKTDREKTSCGVDFILTGGSGE